MLLKPLHGYRLRAYLAMERLLIDARRTNAPSDVIDSLEETAGVTWDALTPIEKDKMQARAQPSIDERNTVMIIDRETFAFETALQALRTPIRYKKKAP